MGTSRFEALRDGISAARTGKGPAVDKINLLAPLLTGARLAMAGGGFTDEDEETVEVATNLLDRLWEQKRRGG